MSVLLFRGVEFVCNADSCCDVVVLLLLLLLLYLGPFTEVADGDDSGDDFLSKILPKENRKHVETCFCSYVCEIMLRHASVRCVLV